MIFTARQLQELHKSNGHVRLPIGARLTPMASDWVRARSIAVAYDEGPGPEGPGLAQSGASGAKPAPLGAGSRASAQNPGTILWWCDGPCGQAKAAIASQSRETFMQPFDAKTIVFAVKHLAREIKADRAAAGILAVRSGAPAVVYANRCPSLRAILGTCREAVQQGLDQLAANVLIIEHPHQSLGQIRNLLGQFVRGRRNLSDEVKRELAELASCG
jgi:hypothetical protein